MLNATPFMDMLELRPLETVMTALDLNLKNGGEMEGV